MWRSSASKANSLAALVYVGGCPVLWGCLRLFQGVPLFSPCTLFAESRSKRVALPAGLSYVIESAYYPETGEQEMPAGVDEGYLSSFGSEGDCFYESSAQNARGVCDSIPAP